MTAGNGAARPRRIFLVANTIVELGGVQRVMHSLAALFTEAEHSVDLVGVFPHPEPHDYGPADGYRCTTLHAEVEPTNAGGRLRRRLDPRRRARRGAAKGAAVDRLRSMLLDAGECFVIVMQPMAMAWARPALVPGATLIGQHHESFEVTQGRVGEVSNAARFLRVMRDFDAADAFLLLTPEDAQRWEAAGAGSTRVMPNPLTLAPGPAAELSAQVVVSLGRHHPQKRHDRMIAAFAQVHARHPDWQLHLYGSGPDRETLATQITHLGLDRVVRLMGPTTDPATALRSGSVFALSSEYEGLPLVLCEAMLMGVPCVSFDCGPGPRAIITDGVDGLVVAEADVGALADGICRLIEDEALRREMGSRAIDAVQVFRPDRVLRRWEQLFDEVER